MRQRALVVFAAVVLMPALVCADVVTIDFETFPDGPPIADSTPITTQFPGLTFANTTVISADISLNEFELPPHSGMNVAFDDGDPISISFVTPITSFAAYFTYYEPLTLEGFNASDTEVASAQSAYSNNVGCDPAPLGCFGDPGSSPNEFLGLNSPSGIVSVTVTGDLAGDSFVMDDLTYTTTPTTVPEPASGSLLAAVILIAFGFSKVFHKTLMKWLAAIGIPIVFGFIFVVWLLGTPATAAPLIGRPSALPTAIAVETTTTVTVLIPIPNPSLVASSVNLLLVGATGTQPTILGVMHDDGLNGDAVEADHIYTLQVLFNQSSTEHIQLEVSAAFQGQLKRVISSPIDVAVTVNGTRPLPPDPGPDGMTTLAGIDSDGDGIRDDVERYIALTYPTSMKERTAVTQFARAYLMEIVDSTNTAVALLDSKAGDYAIDCLFSLPSSDGDPGQMIKALEGQILNTSARLHAYLAAEGQITTAFEQVPTAQQDKTRCMVNPDSLPN